MSRPPYVSIHIRSQVPGRRVAAADIVEAYAGEIRAGRIPGGCRLPPVRALERQLGLSKNTVQAAYDELHARGLLETRPREGVFVAAPGVDPEAPPLPTFQPPLPALKPVPALFRTPPRPGTLRLSSVFIDPELLPRDELEDCFRAVLRRRNGLEPFYDFQGHRPLREAIAQRLARRGMEVGADQIIVTIGSQQGIDLVARSLEVQRVAVENPVYPHARALFARNGQEAVPLPLDPFAGIDLDDWEARLQAGRPALLYAIPSFQNPTGYSYSSHELQRLLALAERHQVALLEDDWGSDMLPDSEYRPSLRLLGGPNVLYLDSFTKKVWPALRIGYLVAPEPLVPTLVAQKRLSTLGSPPLLEATLAEFLERGYYDAHLGRLQAELDRRYQACLETLRARMPPDVRWTTPGGGPTLWLDLPRSVDLPRLRSTLAAREVEVEDASVAFAGAVHLHGFRISYAHAPIADVRRGIEAVSDALAEQRDGDRPGLRLVAGGSGHNPQSWERTPG
jgi:DNA-binding transcriptional MocR family regulator